MSSGGSVMAQQVLTGSGVLFPGSTDSFDVMLNAGFTYNIYVRPYDLAADFDVFVYDQNANLVAGDDTPAADAFCAVTPRWTGPFRIVVRSSRGSSGYDIVVS
jgi:hypothetical protein